jgi:lipid A 4'-phosphatase
MKELSKAVWLAGVLVPLLCLLIYAPFSSSLDLSVSHAFFKDGQFSNAAFWQFIYSYGPVPAWILIGLSLIGLISSFTKRFRFFRAPSFYLIFTLAIGSGIIVHAILKDHWGRPRPRQAIEFGGSQTFKPFYQPCFSATEPSRSFSCGHCTMGFYFFSLTLLAFFYRRWLLFWISFLLTWGLGISLSLARIAQGGHFFSDVLVSFLIMWLTAWIGAFFLLRLSKES